MLLLFISFLAGVLTVLAPCTLSLLPVIVGGSIAEGHSWRRSITITASLGVSVLLFTFILKVSTLFINIPQSFWQVFSGVIILILGFIMVFPTIWERIPLIGKINLSSNRVLGAGYQKNNFWGNVIMGSALGPVFSTCSPTYFLILATVLPRSLGKGMLYLLAYIVGLCGFLLLITVLSQKAIEKLGIASDSHGWIKRTVGVLFFVLGLAIIFGFDKTLELKVSNNVFDVTKIEQKLLTTQAPPSPSISINTQPISDTLSEADRIKIKSLEYQKAPEITDPSGFINTPDGAPITLASFKGKKVVLVDFWTYSCINCQRTIPYLNAWYKKYADQGLEIVSIHTPEFGFEKVQSNVAAAVKRLGIQYPVVMDNDYGTWDAFGNQYWPREYLIDIDGFIVHDHAGEGDYDVTEQAIQSALAERARIVGAGPVATGIVAPSDAITSDQSKVGSPETYFGSSRNEFFGNGTAGTPGTQTLMLPQQIDSNMFYLSGMWNILPEYAETADPMAKIVYKYTAKNVYMVASSPTGATVNMFLDGKPAGSISIGENRLYTLIQGTAYGTHTLELQVSKGTLDAYTFTFG